MNRLKERLSWITDPGTRLGRRAANAGIWAFGLSMTSRLLTTARTLFLARLLLPADFGLMGIALLAIGLVGSFTKTGFHAALVQRSRMDDSDLDTAWTTEVARGLLLGVGLFLAAPLVGDFFDAPTASSLVRVLAVGVALSGFKNIGVVSFERELEFQRRFFYRATPDAIDLVVSVAFAFILRNAWALVFGWIGARLAAVVASYLFHPYRPRFRWSSRRARGLFNFGIWIFASQILLYLMLHLDDLVVGRLLGPTQLGFYQMAYTISQLTTTELTLVVNSVAFPAYSKVQGDSRRLHSAYSKILQLVALFTTPVAAGLFFVGDEAIGVLLGEKWLPLVPAFEVLLIWGFMRSLLATTGPLFHGVGRPQLSTKIQATQLLLLAAFIYPFTAWGGIAGAAWATVAAAVIPDAVALVLASRIATTPLRELFKLLAFPVAHAAIMLIVLSTLDRLGAFPGTVGTLVLAPLAGLVTYFTAAWLSRIFFGYASEGFLGGVTSE